MARIDFTEQQRAAMSASGAGVMVSAAAGSGKTAVLAERCAHLVCDVAPPERCDADELLVVTFTDAAAGEMRARIVEAIRARLAASPRDERLRRQLALVDAARIGTVHAFCNWLARKWFNHLDLDPLADVLEPGEALLLQRELVDALLDDLLEGTRGERTTHRPAAGPDADAASQPSQGVPSHPDLGTAAVELVDAYGLGEHESIVDFILRLHDFTQSLPDPDAWLRDAYDAVAVTPERTVAALKGDLEEELDLQIEHGELLVGAMEKDGQTPPGFPEAIRHYVHELRAWRSALGGEPVPADASATAAALERFERVRAEIAAFDRKRVTGPRLSRKAPASQRERHEAAVQSLAALRKRLIQERLQNTFALFTVSDLLADLRKTGPYLGTLIQLALAFRDAFTRRKRELGVLDFSDQERLAFRLLARGGRGDRPSTIAHSLHDRFRYVLVDEFQDINPLQNAIIHLASRESDPARPSNLFVVGDVKQSIYRFRLAEPALFTARWRRAQLAESPNMAIGLTTNFRSRSPVIDAVNTVFSRLMRADFGGAAYDDASRLRTGRPPGPDGPDAPVELHILEKRPSRSDEEDSPDDGPEADRPAGADPARWSPIEREAYLIGLQVRDWMAKGEFTVDGRPLRFGDVAVLLRAAKVNAERMASILARLGIPAHAAASGSLVATREVRDVMAALELLDNARQDIPLAAVLRSGIFGTSLTVDEMLEIRCHARDGDYHLAVRAYADAGPESDLRRRLSDLLHRVDRLGDVARRRPLAGVLWELLERQGYLAYASGLPGGAQRRANLFELYELARRFSTFRRQGLSRFLSFLRGLDKAKEELPCAPAAGEPDDCIRILTVHKAKGLEFPLVFVAGLGTKFNLDDRKGRLIFDRDAGIGLRALDRDRMIEYPTAAHARVAARIDRETRAEELRVLYVAMTRARDKLVLVGSSDRGPESETDAPAVPSRLAAVDAATPLDWLVTTFVSRPSRPGLAVHFHAMDEMREWQRRARPDDTDLAVRRAVAGLADLPPDEPTAVDSALVSTVNSRLTHAYPHLAASSVRAVVAASEFKGTHDFLSDSDTFRPTRPQDQPATGWPANSKKSASDAASRGILTHRILQHIDFPAASSNGLASELQRLQAGGIVNLEECEQVDSDAIAWFLTTPLAEAIRDAGAAYRREFMFLATEPLDRLDPVLPETPDDTILVRGIVDGVLVHDDALEIVDFKTDAIDSQKVQERCVRYQPQIDLYARAMERLWKRPVQACWLVFLSPRHIARLQPTATWHAGSTARPA